MNVPSVKSEAFYIEGWVYYSDYSNYLNTRQVWYSNGPKVSGCWMVQILNGSLKTMMVVWKPDKKCLIQVMVIIFDGFNNRPYEYRTVTHKPNTLVIWITDIWKVELCVCPCVFEWLSGESIGDSNSRLNLVRYSFAIQNMKSFDQRTLSTI